MAKTGLYAACAGCSLILFLYGIRIFYLVEGGTIK